MQHLKEEVHFQQQSKKLHSWIIHCSPLLSCPSVSSHSSLVEDFPVHQLGSVHRALIIYLFPIYCTAKTLGSAVTEMMLLLPKLWAFLTFCKLFACRSAAVCLPGSHHLLQGKACWNTFPTKQMFWWWQPGIPLGYCKSAMATVRALLSIAWNDFEPERSFGIR